MSDEIEVVEPTSDTETSRQQVQCSGEDGRIALTPDQYRALLMAVSG